MFVRDVSTTLHGMLFQKVAIFFPRCFNTLRRRGKKTNLQYCAMLLALEYRFKIMRAVIRIWIYKSNLDSVILILLLTPRSTEWCPTFMFFDWNYLRISDVCRTCYKRRRSLSFDLPTVSDQIFAFLIILHGYRTFWNTISCPNLSSYL